MFVHFQLMMTKTTVAYQTNYCIEYPVTGGASKGAVRWYSKVSLLFFSALFFLTLYVLLFPYALVPWFFNLLQFVLLEAISGAL